MKLNHDKLESMTHKDDGRIVARCPACAAVGMDRKGNNLVIYSNGKYGCIAFEGDADHRRKIFSLVGESSTQAGISFSINPQKIKDSSTIMQLGRLGRSKSSPDPKKQ